MASESTALPGERGRGGRPREGTQPPSPHSRAEWHSLLGDPRLRSSRLGDKRRQGLVYTGGGTGLDAPGWGDPGEDLGLLCMQQCDAHVHVCNKHVTCVHMYMHRTGAHVCMIRALCDVGICVRRVLGVCACVIIGTRHDFFGAWHD